MKKIILALLILGVIAAITTACTRIIDDNPGTSSSPSIVDIKDPDKVFEDLDKEFYTLVTRETPYTVKAEDGSVIYIANNITSASFVANDRINSPIAKAMNTVLSTAYSRNEKVSDGMLDELNTLEASINEQGGDVSSMQLPWVLESDYSVVRNDGRAISVIENIYYYAGGVHPTSNIYTYNFEPRTGKQITKILSYDDEEAQKAAEELVYNKLVEKYGKDQINLDFISTTLIDEVSDSWYFTKDGIVLYFNTYDIAPYAAGTFEIELSKDELPEEAQRYFK